MRRERSSLRATACLLPLLALAACTRWRAVDEQERWILLARAPLPVEAAAFERAFTPAFACLEEVMGPFAGRVRVHVLEGEEEREVGPGLYTGVQDIPGIGPARVLAYHARSRFSSGVYLSEPDVGTAVHELVHARFAELGGELPLWFEEGFATFLGDGMLVGGRWVVDGLACWPLRELGEQALTRGELERLLAMRPGEEASPRENVLVHFLGWAIVFDLVRETGELDWRALLAAFDHGRPVEDAAERSARTLSAPTALAWLGRLEHDDPAVRMAAAKGTWKLRSRRVLDRLLDALRAEEHPDVRVTLALNALAAAGELRFSGRRWWSPVFRALAEVELADPAERAAAAELIAAYRLRDEERALVALEALERFWQE